MYDFVYWISYNLNVVVIEDMMLAFRIGSPLRGLQVGHKFPGLKMEDNTLQKQCMN